MFKPENMLTRGVAAHGVGGEQSAQEPGWESRRRT